ncbi:MAG TPA: sensor histidine kinase [Terriglobia bacterium]|nr:sensor histidine kinase [Terriglobia bacterium]
MTTAIARPTVVRELVTQVPTVTDRIALVDSHGNIVAVNNAWMALAEKAGAASNRVGPGVNYLEVCRQASGSSTADAREAHNGIRAVLKEKAQSFSMDYACHTPTGPAYFRMVVTPISYRDARVAIAHMDITELQLSRDKSFRRLQEVGRRLIHAQEEERQRISREIHDDLGNRIALMAFSVRDIMKQRSKRSGSTTHQLSEVIDNLTDLSNALRNLSHCLHPPLLRYLGIGAALKTLCEEFKKTRGIRIDVVVPAEFKRLPFDLELCIFRISQECLQNIAKHSGADSARIVLQRTLTHVELTVSDTGRGFIQSDAIQKGGLGLLSMKERVLCIGGRLEVSSSPGVGTVVHVGIPLPEDLRLVRVG